MTIETSPTADFTVLAEIAAQQRQRCQQQQYVLENSPFFAALWSTSPVSPHLEDLPSLPLCDKEMLEEMSTTVLSRIDDGVCTITLNRPERLNAINPSLLSELKAILAAGNADPSVRAFILRGAGRAFCSGDDLKEFDHQAGTEAVARASIESIQDITREMVLGEKMIVGAIHGWAASRASGGRHRRRPASGQEHPVRARRLDTEASRRAI